MNLIQFAELVRNERAELLSRWRQQVREIPAARQLDTPTLNDHVPLLLDELAGAFEASSSESVPEALPKESAVIHGFQRLQDGFEIEEVVAEYNILRGCVHDLASEHGFNLQGEPFHIMNRVFDNAIGLALQTYATERAEEIRQRREDYLAFVVHDLKNPLFAVSLAGHAIERSLPKTVASDDLAPMMTTLRRGIQQLERLVQQVLEENSHVQCESGIKLVRREFDLWPHVAAILEVLMPLAEASGTRLRNAVPTDLTVYADARVLRRIIENLITNAIKYTPQGVVFVEARTVDENGNVELRVSDDGAGIPPGLIDKIFEKGEADPAADGRTGLGLDIVRTFTEAHGGYATVESKKGEGSTFFLTLPAKGGGA